jgi:hypothetical protein
MTMKVLSSDGSNMSLKARELVASFFVFKITVSSNGDGGTRLLLQNGVECGKLNGFAQRYIAYRKNSKGIKADLQQIVFF